MKKIVRIFRKIEDRIRDFLGIRPRNPFLNLRPMMDRLIEENYKELKRKKLID